MAVPAGHRLRKIRPRFVVVSDALWPAELHALVPISAAQRPFWRLGQENATRSRAYPCGAGSLEPLPTHTELSDASTRDATSGHVHTIYLVYAGRIISDIPCRPSGVDRFPMVGIGEGGQVIPRADLVTNSERMACRDRASTASIGGELVQHISDDVDAQRLLGDRTSSDEQ
jgi:hypothetical protein